MKSHCAVSVNIGDSPEERKMPVPFQPFKKKQTKGACPNCDGTGHDPDKAGKCPDCNGTGLIEVHYESTGGM